MRSALKWPVVQALRQALAQRVLADVLQFIFVFALAAKTVMERAPLKGPTTRPGAPAELAFPKLDPLVDAEVQGARRRRSADDRA